MATNIITRNRDIFSYNCIRAIMKLNCALFVLASCTLLQLTFTLPARTRQVRTTLALSGNAHVQSVACATEILREVLDSVADHQPAIENLLCPWVS